VECAKIKKRIKMITCPKCEGVEMDWESDNKLQMSTYVCPLCNLSININWKNDDKR
jgi:Zn-finger nucleic acid-binding protein